jgi:hypothetical protein
MPQHEEKLQQKMDQGSTPAILRVKIGNIALLHEREK